MRSKPRDTQSASLGLRAAALFALLFLHIPLALILLYTLTVEETAFTFPLPGVTTKWFPETWSRFVGECAPPIVSSVLSEECRTDLWNALTLSLTVATIATAIALVLGTLTALAVSGSKFFGRETISFLVVLPIALPGIVTGIALRSTLGLLDIPFSFWTIVIGHATFCIVTVYNNVIARLRRTSGSLIEASMDLGANTFQTFRHVVLPNVATALLAGGMLAFALSFDEVIVTAFTAGQQNTLPIWIFSQLVRPRDRPVTNVVAVFVIAITTIPILLAHRLTSRDQL
ncbi:MAG: ABC transporter permease [Chloroflexi bacterium]|nr:ABC transporter permease [Chloroflexota bacterium]